MGGRRFVAGDRAIVVVLHPAPLLVRGGKVADRVMAPSAATSGRDLDEILKRLRSVPSARGYLAEFAEYSEEYGAPMWRPLLRLNLTDGDAVEASDAPGRNDVEAWFASDLREVQAEEPAGLVPKAP